MTAADIIQNRRSAYPAQFTGEIIPRETIEAILDSARYAPTHRLTQPWRFTVFSGAGRLVFATAWAEAYKQHAGDAFAQTQYDKMMAKPLSCSHIISIGMKRHHIVPEFEEIAAVSCAVQNMMISASDLGVGGYWSTGGYPFFEDFKHFFQLEDDDRLLGFLMMGVPKKLPLPPRLRHEIESFTSWVDGQ